MSRSPLIDRDEAPFFIGYLDTPAPDRRFLLGLTFSGLLAAGAGAAGLAITQRGAGQGSWDMATQVELTGRLVRVPYPMLQTRDLDGRFRTVLLACDTKCGAQDKLAEAGLATGQVRVRGSLLQRDRHVMMAVANDSNWIEPQTASQPIAAPAEESLGRAQLRGEILDAKCWFGAMRPNEGPAHKACAMLCIAGGIPPYFHVRDRMGRERAMMITDPQGGPLIQPVLRYVADPVAAAGELVRVGDIIQFRLDPEDLDWAQA